MSTPDKELEEKQAAESASEQDSLTTVSLSDATKSALAESGEKSEDPVLTAYISGTGSAEKAPEDASATRSATPDSATTIGRTEVSWPDPAKMQPPPAVNSNPEQGKIAPDNSPPLTQAHVSHLVSEVLREPQPEPSAVVRKVRIPVAFDVVLAIGLLFAVGGFTFGLFHMYLVHSAAKAISEQKYRAAMEILKSAPFPQIFSKPGSDTEEMLSKAIYLDAMDRLETDANHAGALKQLSEIKAGSKYFHLAQEAINANTVVAPALLQGGTEQPETSPQQKGQKSLLDKTLNEEEK